METFKLEIPAYGHGRAVGEARYQWIGAQLIKTVEDFLSTNWGSHPSSRGVVYGHFNELSLIRVLVSIADPGDFVKSAVPVLERIRDDLLSSDARERSMAHQENYSTFIRDFDGYLGALKEKVAAASPLAFQVQNHCRPFAGDVDNAWRRARRLDPDQPAVESDLFHKLAQLRDRVFEEPTFASVNAYLEEVTLLKDGFYGTIVAYVRAETRWEKLLQNHDPAKLEALEDELSVDALWQDQARG